MPPHCSPRPARRYPNPLAASAAGKLMPIQVVPGPEVDRACALKPASFGACVLSWSFLTLSGTNWPVAMYALTSDGENHGGTHQGIVPCDDFHYTRNGASCPYFRLVHPLDSAMAVVESGDKRKSRGLEPGSVHGWRRVLTRVRSQGAITPLIRIRPPRWFRSGTTQDHEHRRGTVISTGYVG